MDEYIASSERKRGYCSATEAETFVWRIFINVINHEPTECEV